MSEGLVPAYQTGWLIIARHDRLKWCLHSCVMVYIPDGWIEQCGSLVPDDDDRVWCRTQGHAGTVGLLLHLLSLSEAHWHAGSLLTSRLMAGKQAHWPTMLLHTTPNFSSCLPTAPNTLPTECAISTPAFIWLICRHHSFHRLLVCKIGSPGLHRVPVIPQSFRVLGQFSPPQPLIRHP